MNFRSNSAVLKSDESFVNINLVLELSATSEVLSIRELGYFETPAFCEKIQISSGCPRCYESFCANVTISLKNPEITPKIESDNEDFVCVKTEAETFVSEDETIETEPKRSRGDAVCTICDSTFGNKWALKRHKKICHEEVLKENNQKVEKGEKPKCVECGSSFSSEALLKKHLKKLDSKVRCCQCSEVKDFQCKDAYCKHVKDEHDGVFQCGTCDRQFNSGSCWSNHVKTHDVVGECERCLKTFTKKIEYQQHCNETFKEDISCR